MKKAWKTIDLEGGGLQHVNQRLSRSMKRHAPAYAWWLLFPLGAHRYYLNAYASGLIYPGLSALALLGGFTLHSIWALPPLLVTIGFGLYDLFWIDRRIVSLNKQIRMRICLGTAGTAAPAGYRGRYTDESGLDDYLREKDQERAGIQPVRPGGTAPPRHKAPSFAEQEAMLRALSKRGKDKQD